MFNNKSNQIVSYHAGLEILTMRRVDGRTICMNNAKMPWKIDKQFYIQD